jgi:hypothetical protein
MPEQTTLDKLKLTLGSSALGKDALLQLILDDAREDILSWTNRKELPTVLESTLRQVAVIRFNMMGVEGQTSHSEGGVSRAFGDLPDSIKATLNQHRLAKLVTYHEA